MTESEAFEAAKTTILKQRPDADDFYLDDADFEDGNWIIMIGYLRYWGASDIEKDEYEFLSLTEEDIGTPSGHWQSQVEILPNGDGILNIDDNLGIEEHPEMDESESEWRKWAIEGMSKNFNDVKYLKLRLACKTAWNSCILVFEQCRQNPYTSL